MSRITQNTCELLSTEGHMGEDQWNKHICHINVSIHINVYMPDFEVS